MNRGLLIRRGREQSPPWRRIDADLPFTHAARRLVEVVALLNLQPLFACYSAGGSDALRPDLMLRMVLIEMWSGRRRPSQWFKRCVREQTSAVGGLRHSSVAFCLVRVPRSSGTFARPMVSRGFRPGGSGRDHARPSRCFGRFLHAANASRHHLLNEQRLEKREQELAVACERDAQGEIPEPVPAWMAKTSSTRTEQAQRYRRAKVRLNEFHATNMRQNPARRRAAKKIVVSATDPEAALGLDKERVFRPLYNVQLVKDLDSLLTLNYEVFAQNSDAGTLDPMLQRGRDRFGLLLSDVVCDATYVTGCNLAISAQQQVTLCGSWQANDYSQTATKKKEKPMILKEAFTWLPEKGGNRSRVQNCYCISLADLVLSGDGQ